jgi:hypothetical protein
MHNWASWTMLVAYIAEGANITYKQFSRRGMPPAALAAGLIVGLAVLGFFAAVVLPAGGFVW